MSSLSTDVTPDANPESIDWKNVIDINLEDKDNDSLDISLAKFDERRRREREAFQRIREEQKRREAEEAEQKRKEAEEAERKQCEAEEAEWKRQEADEAECIRQEEERRQKVGEAQMPEEEKEGSTSPNTVVVVLPCTICSKSEQPCMCRAKGRSKACISCQTLKARCDLSDRILAEKRSATSQAGRKASKRRRKSMVIWSDDEEEQEESQGEGEGEGKKENLKLVIRPRVRFVPPTSSTTQEPFVQTFKRCMGNIVKALDRNMAAVTRMSVDLQDLSGHLDESFEVLRTLGTALANRALNEDDNRRRNE